MEDYQITLLFWQRNEAAIYAARDKYGTYCRSIALAVLGDYEDALECENDTYLGAWNAIPPHRPQRLSTYLGKITRRISLDKWKSLHTRKRGGGEVVLALEELGECIASGETPQQKLEVQELTLQINAFLKALPETEQQVFICRYWYLSSVKTIAKQFDFSESKVKSMLCRTRLKLKAHLEKEGMVV